MEGILEEPVTVDVLACISSQSHCSKFIPGCSISLSFPCSWSRVCKAIFKMSSHAHNKGFSGLFSATLPCYFPPWGKINVTSLPSLYVFISWWQKPLWSYLSWEPCLFHNSKQNIPLNTLEAQAQWGQHLRISCSYSYKTPLALLSYFPGIRKSLKK